MPLEEGVWVMSHGVANWRLQTGSGASQGCGFRNGMKTLVAGGTGGVEIQYLQKGMFRQLWLSSNSKVII